MSALKAEAENKDTGDLKGKPRMGVSVRTVTGNGVLPNGVLVVSVEENSPAADAGLQPNDIMVEVNGQVIKNVSEEMAIVSQLKEGDEVQVKVFRMTDTNTGDGEYIDLTVKLAMLDDVHQ